MSLPAGLTRPLQSWPENVAKYKGGDLYTPVLLPYLDDLHDRQLAAGTALLDAKDADSDKYPF